jgi:hypothetical protein
MGTIEADKILDEAIAEAERFLKKAKQLRQFRRSVRGTVRYSYVCVTGHGTYNAAAKRASLDLSKILVSLRR